MKKYLLKLSEQGRVFVLSLGEENVSEILEKFSFEEIIQILWGGNG